MISSVYDLKYYIVEDIKAAEISKKAVFILLLFFGGGKNNKISN